MTMKHRTRKERVFNEATGWYYYDYLGKPEDFKERSKRLLWFGPTRLYFSIGYDLLMRKKR